MAELRRGSTLDQLGFGESQEDSPVVRRHGMFAGTDVVAEAAFDQVPGGGQGGGGNPLQMVVGLLRAILGF